MNKLILTLGTSAIATAMLVTGASADDRPATAAERAHIGSILRANGYTSWKKIEFDRDDRKFEVDNARHENGGVYDIDIRGDRIVKRERD